MTFPGVDEYFFVATETTFDTAQAFTAGQAIQADSLDIEPSYAIEKSKEKLGSASLHAEFAGMQGGKWKMTLMHRTNAAGTAPPSDALWRGSFNGAPTFPGGNSTLYNLTVPAAPITLQIAKRIGTARYEQINGAVVEQVEVELSPSGARVTFSGSFASFGWYGGGATTTATVTAGATTFTLAATSQDKIGRNARIQIGTDNNSNAGYLVTGVTAAGVVTFTPALVGTQTGATAVIPYTPTPTYSGTLLAGVDALLTVDGTTTDFESAKISFKTGNHLLDKESSRTRPGRASRGERDITIEVQAYADESGQQSLALLDGAWNLRQRNIILRIGSNTAAQRLQFEAPSTRIGVAPVKVPENEEATLALMGQVRRSAANEDEFALRLN